MMTLPTHFEDCTHCENGNRTRYGCCQFCDGFGHVEVGDGPAADIEDLDERCDTPAHHVGSACREMDHAR